MITTETALDEKNPQLFVLGIKEPPPRTQAEWLEREANRAAIVDVMNQYGHYCDVRDYVGVCNLYTEDVERVLGGDLDERVKGKANLYDKYIHPTLRLRADGKSAAASREQRTVRHMFATPVIRIASGGKEAWATMYFSLVTTSNLNGAFRTGHHEGTYLFHLVKQGYDWKIKKLVDNTEIGNDPMYPRK